MGVLSLLISNCFLSPQACSSMCACAMDEGAGPAKLRGMQRRPAVLRAALMPPCSVCLYALHPWLAAHLLRPGARAAMPASPSRQPSSSRPCSPSPCAAMHQGRLDCVSSHHMHQRRLVSAVTTCTPNIHHRYNGMQSVPWQPGIDIKAWTPHTCRQWGMPLSVSPVQAPARPC